MQPLRPRDQCGRYLGWLKMGERGAAPWPTEQCPLSVRVDDREHLGGECFRVRDEMLGIDIEGREFPADKPSIAVVADHADKGDAHAELSQCDRGVRGGPAQ